MGQGQGSNLGAFPVSYVANLFHFVSPLKASYRHKIPDLSRSPPSFFLTLSHELAPHTPQRNAGQLTTGFALGQLLGPLLAALSTHFAGGLQPALALAGLGLVFAGLLLRRPHSLSVAAGVAATARR